MPDYCWRTPQESDCFGPHSCENVTGGEVTVPIKAVFRAQEGTPIPESPADGKDNQVWDNVGWACYDGGIITWQDVWAVAQNLEWPGADLIIQPPNGRTLINFDTNFYTDHTTPESQGIRVKGRNVDVAVATTTYTWNFDDPDDPNDAESTGPGVRITSKTPDGQLPAGAITHRYVTADLTVEPSVDVTYTLRYRIGDGDWIDLPNPVTVTGTAVTLETVEAKLRLVG